MRLFSLYLPGDDLTLAELSAARLDGELFEIGDGYIASDVDETMAFRARSLAPVVGASVAATHLTAAWIHGARDAPPTPIAVQRAVARRPYHVPQARVLYRDGLIPAADLLRCGGIAFTAIPRTLVDLARVGDDEHLAAGRALASVGAANVRAALEWVERRRTQPHMRRAAAALRGWDQPDVTR